MTQTNSDLLNKLLNNQVTRHNIKIYEIHVILTYIAMTLKLGVIRGNFK